jgi:hypothetical protein
MNRAIGLALLAVGIVLLVLGINASESLGSDISRFFSGTPTDESIWMLLGGAACIVVGLFGTLAGRRASTR